MQSLLLLLSLVALAFGAGYAPIPQAAPAASSYGNPLPNQFSPVYVPQNGQQQGWNSQQNGFNNIPNTVNSVPRNGFSGQSQGVFGGNANGLSGNGAVASLASEDDWDSVITARGVRNFKFRPNRHH